MRTTRASWQEDLAIIDRIMRSVSDITDPEEMVNVYWEGVRQILPFDAYLSLSRRGVTAPDFLITRSSRFTEDINPWTQRDRLPLLRGGLLGEIAYADRPLVIENLDERLRPDDPGHFYLEGYRSLVALPQYEGGHGLNVGISLIPAGVDFDPSIVPMMHWQASLFGRGTQSLVLRKQLTSALESLDRELQVVGEIQRTLLPSELPNLPGWQIDAWYETSARAGGDYYDFFPVTDHEWGILIADVAGHGTPAAVLMAITHAIAHSRPGAPTPPGALLAHVNRHLSQSYTRSGAFVTAFYGVLNAATGALTFACAGHPPPRLVRCGAAVSIDEDGGLPLGIAPDEVYTEATTQVDPGDSLVLYTDGITETMAPRSAEQNGVDLYGVERLDRAIAEACHDAPRRATAIVERVRAGLEAHSAGAPAQDDRTLVALTRSRSGT